MDNNKTPNLEPPTETIRINEQIITETSQLLQCSVEDTQLVLGTIAQANICHEQGQVEGPPFDVPEIVDAMNKIGCNALKAADVLSIMQQLHPRASFGIPEVADATKQIDCDPMDAINVLFELQTRNQICTRPLSDIKNIMELIPEKGLKYAFDLYCRIQDYQSGKISEDEWYKMSVDVNAVNDIIAAEEILNMTRDFPLATTSHTENVKNGKDVMDTLIAELDKMNLS